MAVLNQQGGSQNFSLFGTNTSGGSRLATSGLPVGGAFSKSGAPIVSFQSPNNIPIKDDWRVRISLSQNSKIFYKDPSNAMMSPLRETDGVIFPYTPSITVTHQAIYSPQTLTHSNYSPLAFQNSDISDINITGEFTVQYASEGQYLLAAIYFFRSATKMFFGNQARNQGYSGNPPPLVFLDGYGSHYFPHVTCVVSSFQHQMPQDVDYIEVPVPGSTMTTRLPTSSSITLTVKPVYSRKNLHENFGLSDFAAGRLLGGAASGGFL